MARIAGAGGVRRLGPRPFAPALERVARQAAPATTLARVQGSWKDVVGEAVAREAEPVTEQGGVVTVACRSAAWAQELELMSGDLADRLSQALGTADPTATVRAVRAVVRSASRIP